MLLWHQIGRAYWLAGLHLIRRELLLLLLGHSHFCIHEEIWVESVIKVPIRWTEAIVRHEGGRLQIKGSLLHLIFEVCSSILVALLLLSYVSSIGSVGMRLLLMGNRERRLLCWEAWEWLGVVEARRDIWVVMSLVRLGRIRRSSHETLVLVRHGWWSELICGWANEFENYMATIRFVSLNLDLNYIPNIKIGL